MNAFDRIIGYEGLKKELMQVVDGLRNGGAYERLGVKPPRGLLLHGEPGVGKSLMASCLIEASGRKAFVCRKDRPDGEFVNHITETFRAAKEAAPSIVFLDDMDKFANGDERNPDAEEFVTVQSCIDECRDSGVFVLATANNIRVLPRSLKRAGRFDRIIEVAAPEGKDAEKIVAHYFGEKQSVESVDAAVTARMLDGRSCAELETVINEAGLLAGYERSEVITMDHVMKACLHLVHDVPMEVINGFGTEKDEEAGKNLLRTAYHEAGHAVIAEVLNPGSVVLATAYDSEDSDMGGFVSCSGKTKGSYLQRAESHIIQALGGMAASEQVFGEPDTGSEHDIAQAFALVNNFVGDICLRGFQLHCNGYNSQETKAKQEQAAAAEVERYFRKAKEILAKHRPFLDGIARGLMKKGFLTAPDIAEIRKNCEKAA